MSAVGDFAGALEAMSSLIPEDDSWWPFGDDPDPLEEFMTTVDSILGVAMNWIPKIVTGLMSTDIQGGDEGLKKMEIIANAMAAIGTDGGPPAPAPFPPKEGERPQKQLRARKDSGVVAQGKARINLRGIGNFGTLEEGNFASGLASACIRKPRASRGGDRSCPRGTHGHRSTPVH